MAFFGFENLIGLFSLLILIPFIIIYLIRPKPQEMEIPSLMFFMKSFESKQKRSFFKKFLKDFLFFLQLLILLLAAFSLASPFLNIERDIKSSNIALVLDVSASMQSSDNQRFSNMIKHAKENIGKKTTVILAKSFPSIALEEKDPSEVESFLNSLKPTDSRSKIGDAVLLASETLSGKEGRVIVISDFINTEGTPPETARGVVKSKGFKVDFINVGDKNKNNVGIVELELDEDSTTIHVKNYDERQHDIALDINGNKKSLSIKPNSVELYKFKTVTGLTKIEILDKDALHVDNVAYTSVPEPEKIKILLITNLKSLFLESALNSNPNVDLHISEPPVIDKNNYDLYILQGLSQSSILEGTYQDLLERVEKGSNLIIYAQPDSKSLDYDLLLPVKLNNLQSGGLLEPNQVNIFTKDIEFGRTSNHFSSELKPNSVSLVKRDNSSIISLKKQGNGQLFYYGILDKESDFKLTPYYPIFWTNVLKALTGQQDLNSLNFRTGDLISQKNEKVKDSDGNPVTSISFDNSGIYTLGDKKIAVSLLNDKESDISSTTNLGKTPEDFKLREVKDKYNLSLTTPLLIIAGILLLFELLYTKIKGEL